MSEDFREVCESLTEDFCEKLIKTLSHEQMTPLNAVINLSSIFIQKEIESNPDYAILGKFYENTSEPDGVKTLRLQIKTNSSDQEDL